MKFRYTFVMLFCAIMQLFYFQEIHAIEEVPSNLQYIIQADENNPVNDLYLSNEKLFVNRRGIWATSYNYIDIYDVSTPSTPLLARSNKVNCVGNDIFAHKKIVYILGPNDICAYQLNSDNSLKELYNYEFRYSSVDVHNNIFKIGNIVILNRVTRGLYYPRSAFYFIDFSNGAPSLEEYSTTFSGRMVKADSQFLYTIKRDTVYKYNINDPDNVKLVDTIEFPYDIQHISIHKNKIFINLFEAGYGPTIYNMDTDIMDILGDLGIGHCPHYREKIIGDKLFAYRVDNSCKPFSHAVFDISVPMRRPAFEGYKKWLGRLQEVVLISTYKYFALGKGGLAISKNK